MKTIQFQGMGYKLVGRTEIEIQFQSIHCQMDKGIAVDKLNENLKVMCLLLESSGMNGD